MKTIIIQVSDEEYKTIEEKAKKEGYSLISDYVKALLLSSSPSETITRQQSVLNINELVLQISARVERKVQDLLNPFTSQIADLRKRNAEIIERIEELQSMNQEEEYKKRKDFQQYTEDGRSNNRRGRKTAMEILNEQGVSFESELKLKNTDAYFNKLEREGAKIIYLESERIAMSPKYYEEFKKKISELNISDPEEVASKLGGKDGKLFKKLVASATVLFNADKKCWEFIN